MKLATIAAGLFILSYLAVNRGLGPSPVALVVPLIVVLATSFAAERMIGRRKPRAKPKGFDNLPETPVRPQPIPPARNSTMAPGAPGGKARKLF